MTITKDSEVLILLNGTHPLVRMGIIPASVVKGTVVNPLFETSSQVLERLQRVAPEEVAQHPGETPMPSVLVNAIDDNGVINTYLCADMGQEATALDEQGGYVTAPMVSFVERFNPDSPQWEITIPDSISEEDLNDF